MAVNKKYSHNRVPHRTLLSGMRGLDVAQLQHALNKRLEARREFWKDIGIKDLLKASGNFDKATHKVWILMAKACGFDHRKCTIGNQLLMRSPWIRGREMKKKERSWTQRAKKVLAARKAKGKGGNAAVKYLVERVGHIEFNNRAAWLDDWARKYVGPWMIGQPWCGLACLVAWAHAGKKLPQGVVYTPNIVNWAKQGKYFQRVSPSDARAGDLVVINFPGGNPVADHVALARGPARGGMIPTVEGNTSKGNGGSQGNGGGIWIRSRPVGLIAVVARPK